MSTHHKPYALSSIENHVGINRGRKKVTIIGLNPINLTYTRIDGTITCTYVKLPAIHYRLDSFRPFALYFLGEKISFTARQKFAGKSAFA